MKNLLSIAICTAVATAGISAVDAIAQSTKDQPAAISAGNQQQAQGSSRRKFKMKLSLSKPSDLRIREGDLLAAGQVISDRYEERTRLEGQKAQILLNLKALDSPIITPVPLRPIPPLAKLPDPIYLPQWAAIDYERLKLAEADEAKISQAKKIEALKNIPGIDPIVMDHEQEKTRELSALFGLQVSQLKKAEAELERAKQEQAQAEYEFRLQEGTRAVAIQQHELERSNQLAQQGENERERAFKKASLQQNLTLLENQIDALSSVKSPYAGKVQRVKFNEQNDRVLSVDIVLAINPSGGNQPNDPGPKATNSSQQGQ